jgi:hypothetical protein
MTGDWLKLNKSVGEHFPTDLFFIFRAWEKKNASHAASGLLGLTIFMKPVTIVVHH